MQLAVLGHASRDGSAMSDMMGHTTASASVEPCHGPMRPWRPSCGAKSAHAALLRLSCRFQPRLRVWQRTSATFAWAGEAAAPTSGASPKLCAPLKPGSSASTSIIDVLSSCGQQQASSHLPVSDVLMRTHFSPAQRLLCTSHNSCAQPRTPPEECWTMSRTLSSSSADSVSPISACGGNRT